LSRRLSLVGSTLSVIWGVYPSAILLPTVFDCSGWLPPAGGTAHDHRATVRVTHTTDPLEQAVVAGQRHRVTLRPEHHTHIPPVQRRAASVAPRTAAKCTTTAPLVHSSDSESAR